MDVSVLQWELSTISSCASLFLTYGILGMRLQLSTAKRRCALGGMMYDMTTPIGSRNAQKKRTRTKRQIQTFAGARRDNKPAVPKKPSIVKPKKSKAFKMGKLSPEDFETYFIDKYLITPKPTKDFVNVFTTATTSQRDLHYYEPYWANGSWILYTPIPDERISPKEWGKDRDWRLATLPTTNLDDPSSVSWKLMRHCFPICLTIYRDFGPICGTRLVEQGYYWTTLYKDFDDFCQLQYFNCAYYEYWIAIFWKQLIVLCGKTTVVGFEGATVFSYRYKIAHRGKCPEKYSVAEMDPTKDQYYYYLFPKNWLLDRTHLNISYPLWFPQRLSKKWHLQDIDPSFQQEPILKLDTYKWYNYYIWQYKGMLGWFG